MSQKDYEDFSKEISKNEKLKNEILKISKNFSKKDDPEKLKAFFDEKIKPIAKKYGFQIEANDYFKSLKNENSKINQNINYDELENVSGGLGQRGDLLDTASCPCVNVGSGILDRNRICGCYVGGGGSSKTASKNFLKKASINGVCACVLAGSGNLRSHYK